MLHNIDTKKDCGHKNPILFTTWFIKNKAPEVILIANIRTVDEWRGLADMLGNLIAKYASVLDELEKSDTPDKEEQEKAA